MAGAGKRRPHQDGTLYEAVSVCFQPVYIASNGATINAKGRIASTGLDRYIDDLFISEDMGVTKPDAAFFDLCLKRIGEPASSCIMIGDSLSSDMLGARNAGLDSVWFMPGGNVEEAMKTYEIND